VARSIHATRRQLEEEWRARYGDARLADERLRRVREQLHRKRTTKRAVNRERRHSGERGITPPETIPVRVVEAGASILYPCADDLLPVMAALPQGSLDGLGGIDLTLGRYAEHERHDPDPFTGRRGWEFVPGMWRGAVLGTYNPHDGTIDLFAVVCDPACEVRELLEPYLRLVALGTFVHEVAHHEDDTRRVARGRWRADDRDKFEAHAQEREYEWTRSVVIPYLHARYPDEVERLLGWIKRNAGIRVSLEALAGDPREHRHTFRWCVPLSGAFEALVRDVVGDMNGVDARLEFAHSLQLGEHYDEIVGVVESILAEQPGHHGALLEHAEALYLQRRFDEAEAIARRVIADDHTSAAAWSCLSSIQHDRFEWHALVESATRAYLLWQVGDRCEATYELEKRARGLLAVRDFDGLDADLRELERLDGWTSAAATLRAVMLLKTGMTEQAFGTAKRLLADPSLYRTHRPEVAAVRFEAARRLGRPREAGTLTLEMLQEMRASGYGEWVDRLEPLVAPGLHSR
jgi:hypothetical protein